MAILESTGIIEVKTAAVPSKMAFDKEFLTIPANRSISIVFDNPDAMPHNVVIVKPGTSKKVGKGADDRASLKDGFEKIFIPAMPEVLFATPLVNGGKTFRVDLNHLKCLANIPSFVLFLAISGYEGDYKSSETHPYQDE